MNNPQTIKTSISRRLSNLITQRWVADVREDNACCEFSCRELYCEQRRWETCEHRLHHMAIVKERRIKVQKATLPNDGRETLWPDACDAWALLPGRPRA